MSGTLAAERVAASGHCPVCAARGQAVLAAPGQTRCIVHMGRSRVWVETTGTGQTRLTVPAGARRRVAHPTGLQTPCVSCASAGRDTQGLPRDGEGSDALCIPCWRTRTEAAQRRRVAAERRAALEASLVVDEAPVCAACGAEEPSPSCWLCGYSWLAELRATFERDQALEDAAVEARFAQLTQRAEAEQRVAELAGWVDRLQVTVSAYAAGGGRGRAVELLADVLSREAGARVCRRGRPSRLARVAAVLAVDSDWRTGRRALPGRERSAQLAGCTTRTVTDCWARAEALGWATRTHHGRRLSLAERTELGRCNDRAEFDLAPLHRGDPAVRAPYIPVALLVLDDLVQHALVLLAAAQDDLDALIARTAGVVDHAALARRAQLRHAVAAARDTLLTDVEAIATAQIETGNFFSPRSASQGEYLSSCLSRGFAQPPTKTHSTSGDPSRGEGGASRSTTRGSSGAHRVARPRTRQGTCASPRRPRPRPEWHGWAYPLAQAAQQALAWLQAVPLPRVAATIGARLGPAWTIEAMLDTIDRARGGRELLTDPERPLGYLVALLDTALTGEHEPPHPARRHDAHRQAAQDARRRDLVDQATAATTARNTTRADWAAREQARQAERAGPGTARHTALAAARAAGRGDHTTARAIAAAEAENWPEVAQPGAGTYQSGPRDRDVPKRQAR
ncbi:hypothetical protein [Salinispora mooreana]|uniref:hypothetical protein n=2 Tax=Salinispora mooreana TaxID=999545 RepID=UPI001CC76AD5|nr:hypothetical protein [Salinispora mooreana]